MAAPSGRFHIVVAASLPAFGIGRSGGLPWRLPGDMDFFRRLTSTPQSPLGERERQDEAGQPTCTSMRRNAVIMGRKTWESIPQKHRPLKERWNYVISRDPQYLLGDSSVHLVSSLAAALDRLAARPAKEVGSIYVIGGGEIYREALATGLCDLLFITWIHSPIECDTFLPLSLANDDVPSVAGGHVQRVALANSTEQENGQTYHGTSGSGNTTDIGKVFVPGTKGVFHRLSEDQLAPWLSLGGRRTENQIEYEIAVYQNQS